LRISKSTNNNKKNTKQQRWRNERIEPTRNTNSTIQKNQSNKMLIDGERAGGFVPVMIDDKMGYVPGSDDLTRTEESERVPKSVSDNAD
jgi:hypothetical protein